MKKFLKTYWKTLAFFAVMGLVGGFCVGLYLMDSYPAEIVRQLLDQGFTSIRLGAVTAIQSAGYGLFWGAVGIFFAKKVGLWKDEVKFGKTPVLAAVIVSVIGGLAMILPDVFFFGNYSQAIRDSYLVKPTLVFILGAVVYGGVIEEVMLRLFLLSGIAFVLHRLFGKGREKPSTGILVTANIISALLFAAGHLPATAVLMGLTPMILVRCFLLNGGIGLLFGWLYRKHGIQYSMLSHALLHVVSKLILSFA